MFLVKENIKSGKYLSSLPYGFTGGYFSDDLTKALVFPNLDLAKQGAKACFNCAKLAILCEETHNTVSLEDSNGKFIDIGA